MVFKEVALLGNPGQLPLQAPDLGITIIANRNCRHGELLVPPLKQMLAHAQTPGNLRYRMAPINNLGHRVPLEIPSDIDLTHFILLASNLGKKVSTNLGAIH